MNFSPFPHPAHPLCVMTAGKNKEGACTVCRTSVGRWDHDEKRRSPHRERFNFRFHDRRRRRRRRRRRHSHCLHIKTHFAEVGREEGGGRRDREEEETPLSVIVSGEGRREARVFLRV